MLNPTKVAIYKKTVLAATRDTIYQWRDPKENIAISFEKADDKLELDGVIITCLKTFKERVLVGTECGHLIIFSLSPLGEDKKTYKLSSNSITSIRLFQGECIKATVCSNKDTFIEGILNGNELDYQETCRDHLVQDARMVEDNGSYKLYTIGLKEGRLYKQKENICSPMFHDRDDLPGAEVVDISEQGFILMNDYEGYIFLRHISDKSIMQEGCNNEDENAGGVGVLVPSQAGHFVIYLGYQYSDVRIFSFETEKNELRVKYYWHGEEECEGFISSMDYYEDRVVLGGGRSIILLNLEFIINELKFSEALYDKEEMAFELSDPARETLDDDASKVSEKFGSEVDDDQGETSDPGESTSGLDDDQGEIPDPGESTSDSEDDQIPDSEQSASTSDEDQGMMPDFRQSIEFDSEKSM